MLVLQSLSKAFGADTSNDLPPLQGKGVSVSVAKRTMPRVLDPVGYEKLRQLVERSHTPAAITHSIFHDVGAQTVGDLLPKIRFPKTASVLNTLPSFYQSYTQVRLY
jgi:hypothetical protein